MSSVPLQFFMKDSDGVQHLVADIEGGKVARAVVEVTFYDDAGNAMGGKTVGFKAVAYGTFEEEREPQK